jgi:putative DNA primase/helicase
MSQTDFTSPDGQSGRAAKAAQPGEPRGDVPPDTAEFDHDAADVTDDDHAADGVGLDGEQGQEGGREDTEAQNWAQNLLTASEEEDRQRAYEAAQRYAADYELKILPVWSVHDNGVCRCKAGKSCPNPGKHPYDLDWPTVATSDSARAARWWRPPADEMFPVDWRPQANIGAMMGGRHALVDIDTGDGKVGDHSLDALLTHHGEDDLPATLMWRTGGGGSQNVFLVPEGVEVRNSASRLAPDIDVRGLHGFGILPPSSSGKGPYRMLIDRAPAPAPSWLADWWRDEQERRTSRPCPAGSRPLPARLSPRARAYVAGALTRAAEKLAAATARNNTLNEEVFALASRFGSTGLLEFDDVLTVMWDGAEQCGVAQEEPSKTRATLERAWRDGIAKPAYDALPDWLFREEVTEAPSIERAIRYVEATYDLRPTSNGEFAGRPTTRELPALVMGIDRQMTHFVGRWWRQQAEAFNAGIEEQHLRDLSEAQAVAAADGKDPDTVRVEKPEGAEVFPKAETFSNVNLHLEISASSKDPVDLFTRCWADSRRVVVDLADPSGNVVLIGPDPHDPYRVVDPREPGDLPWFRRSTTMGVQVHPASPGTVDVLAQLVHLRRLLGYEPSSSVWLLSLGWILGSHFSDIDRPGVWMTGPTGAGKTTRLKMMVNLIDPIRELGGDPDIRRDSRNSRTRAMNRFVFSMDNMDDVSRATSDFWCTLHTGYSDEVRKQYTDNVPLEYSYKRIGAATSLALPPGLAPDALRRTLHLSIPAGNASPDKSQLWADYEAAKPENLGAIYMILSAILRRLPNAQRADLRVPWMSDYARRLHAADLEYGLGLFSAYLEHTEAIFESRGTEDPFVDLVLAFLVAKEKTGSRDFAGKASVLLDELEKFRPEGPLHKWWPADAAQLSKRLAELTTLLHTVGVEFRPVDPNLPARRRSLTLSLIPGRVGDDVVT